MPVIIGISLFELNYPLSHGKAASQELTSLYCLYGFSKSNLWEEVEEGVDALAELGFDLFSGAFEQVHGDAGGVSVFELDGGFSHRGDFF